MTKETVEWVVPKAYVPGEVISWIAKPIMQIPNKGLDHPKIWVDIISDKELKADVEVSLGTSAPVLVKPVLADEQNNLIGLDLFYSYQNQDWGEIEEDLTKFEEATLKKDFSWEKDFERYLTMHNALEKIAKEYQDAWKAKSYHYRFPIELSKEQLDALPINEITVKVNGRIDKFPAKIESSAAEGPSESSLLLPETFMTVDQPITFTKGVADFAFEELLVSNDEISLINISCLPNFMELADISGELYTKKETAKWAKQWEGKAWKLGKKDRLLLNYRLVSKAEWEELFQTELMTCFEYKDVKGKVSVATMRNNLTARFNAREVYLISRDQINPSKIGMIPSRINQLASALAEYHRNKK